MEITFLLWISVSQSIKYKDCLLPLQKYDSRRDLEGKKGAEGGKEEKEAEPKGGKCV